MVVVRTAVLLFSLVAARAAAPQEIVIRAHATRGAASSQRRELSNVIGESTGFKVEQPMGVQGCFDPWCNVQGEYVHAEGLFGVPSYGAGKRIVGRLHYVTPQVNNTGCTETYPTDFVADNDDKIFLVDRGDCHFVEKVRVAERKGAAAVVIADNNCMCTDQASRYTERFKQLCDAAVASANPAQCERNLPFMADDGSGEDIGIPSFLITMWEAQRLKDCYNTAGGRISSSESVTGVTCRAGQPIIVSLEWDMPSPDGNVEWDLWTNSDDVDHTLFKQKFELTAGLLAEFTTFTPHYFIWDGDKWGCTTPGQRCSTQCTNDGRYCSVDPDQKLNEGVSGADVVNENLRQLCIWKQANQTVKTDGGKLWWEYVTTFSEKCHATKIASKEKFNEACSKDVHKVVGLSYAETQRCVAESQNSDGSNSLLQAELDSRTEKNILLLPTVVVNNVVLRGGVTPVSVLSTICSGFQHDMVPGLCSCVETHSKDDVLLCTSSQCPTSEKPYFCNYNTECVATEADCDKMYPSSGGVSVPAVIVIVLTVAGALGTAALVYWRRAKAQMRAEVRNILAEYMPLEEIPSGSMRSKGNHKNPEADDVGLI